MATVTYKNQPGIHKTRGTIPLAGTAHVYTVSKRLWPDEVEEYLQGQLIGSTLHICCGKSRLGDVRLDMYEQDVDVLADAARLPFDHDSFDTVLCDPPYNGIFRWQHDVLDECARIARKRIIYQAHYSPVDKYGRFKKCHAFVLTQATIVPDIPDYGEYCLAVKSENGYVIVENKEVEVKDFILSGLVDWQPRTYFGRVQLISILDRVGGYEKAFIGTFMSDYASCCLSSAS
jgi:hypothetical protein